jgi:hypothetical protein
VLLLDEVLMVPSSSITIAANDERLTCGGFSRGEPVYLGIFELIIDYFSSLSLYPRRGNDGAVFVGSTRSGACTPQRAMIEDSPEEFLTASSRKGSFSHLSPRRRSTGGPTHPHYNSDMKGERSGHDDVSPADGGALAGNQLALGATSCSQRRTTGALPHSAPPWQTRICVTTEQPYQRADRILCSRRRGS